MRLPIARRQSESQPVVVTISTECSTQILQECHVILVIVRLSRSLRSDWVLPIDVNAIEAISLHEGQKRVEEGGLGTSRSRQI
jgi:hypothetical protein